MVANEPYRCVREGFFSEGVVTQKVSQYPLRWRAWLFG
jgi:hypothetical protein